jgi:hypothetical protein
MTSDAAPPQNDGASDESHALLTLLAQADADHRAGRTLDTDAVDDILRAHLAGRRGAQ